MTTAIVKLWGTTAGYVAMDKDERFARFEYDPRFEDMGVELAPLMMPVKAKRIYQFTDLHPQSFHGMPGLLADSLPDKYGQRLIDVWLARTGRRPEHFNAVETASGDCPPPMIFAMPRAVISPKTTNSV